MTIFDGATGATLRTHVDPWLPGSDFGHGFDGIGDATGDGVDDYAIGAPIDGQFAVEGGALYLYDGPTGQVAQSVFGMAFLDRVGSKVSGLREDHDGDGRMDFLAHGSGGVNLHSGATLVVLQTLPPETVWPVGQEHLSAIPDQDGDGLAEWMARVESFPRSWLVYSPGRDEILFQQSGSGEFPASMDALGDLDGNGTGEFAYGYIGAFALSGVPLYAKEKAIASGTNHQVHFDLNAGLPRAGNAYVLLMGVSGTQPGVPVGSQTLPLNIDAVTTLSILFANTAPFVNTLGVLDGSGNASATFDGTVLPPQAMGLKFAYAYYSAGPGGLYVSQNPVEIPVLEVPPPGS